jgi:hypothetical protein
MASNPTQGMDICVRIYSVFVLSFVQVAALRRADYTRPRRPTDCVNKYYETDEVTRAQARAVEPLMNEMNKSRWSNEKDKIRYNFSTFRRNYMKTSLIKME